MEDSSYVYGAVMGPDKVSKLEHNTISWRKRHNLISLSLLFYCTLMYMLSLWCPIENVLDENKLQ